MAPSSTYATPVRSPPATEMATESARFRWPLTSPVLTAAPASTMRSVTRRPWSGSSTMRSFSTTSEMPALCTSTSGVAASTDTVSSRLPTASTALIGRSGAHLQHDAGLDVGAEALQRHLQPVRTGRQVRHHVRPVSVGDDGPGEAGVGLRHGDRDAGQHGAALVSHRAAHLRGRLRPDRGGATRRIISAITKIMCFIWLFLME